MPPNKRRATLVTSPSSPPCGLELAGSASIATVASLGKGNDGGPAPAHGRRGTPSPWDEAVHRAYLDKLTPRDRAVLDSFVAWVGGAAKWETFFTMTWSDEYADEHKGLYGPGGAVRWAERFFRSELGYGGSLVISPEGHKWRDVWHVHGLAERFPWSEALQRFQAETGSSNGFDLCRAQAAAVPYVCKYALKDGNEHQVLDFVAK